MNCSVIIPTYNRAEHLRTVLSYLEKQDTKDFSVIMVNDGSTDETQTVLEEIKDGYSYPIIPLNQENKGRSGARNEGVKAAPEGLIVFIDDDMIPEKDFISKHLKHHRKHPESMVSGWAYSHPEAMKTDFQQYKIHIEKIWYRPFKQEPFFQVGFDNFHFTTANLSLTKKLFEEIGGYDTRLKNGVDFDFGTRALLMGKAIFYNAEIVAWHNDLVSLDAYIRRHKQYFFSDKFLLELHPEYAQHHPKFKQNIEGVSFELPPWKKLLYTAMRTNGFKEFVKHSAIFRTLPQKLRFRFYDVILAAHLHD